MIPADKPITHLILMEHTAQANVLEPLLQKCQLIDPQTVLSLTLAQLSQLKLNLPAYSMVWVHLQDDATAQPTLEALRARLGYIPLVLVTDTPPHENGIADFNLSASAPDFGAAVCDILLQDFLNFQAPLQNTERKIISCAHNMRTPEQTIEDFFDILLQILPFDAGNIAFFEQTSMVVHYWYQYDTQVSFSKAKVLIDSPNMTRLITERAPIHIPNVTSSGDWQDIEPFNWVRAWAGIPILKSTYVTGVVNLDSAKPFAYSPHHLRMMSAIIPVTSMLMELIQLYDTLGEYSTVLSAINRQNAVFFSSLSQYRTLDEICEGIAHTVVSVFGKTNCSVLLLNAERTEFERFASVGTYNVQAPHIVSLTGDSGLLLRAYRLQRTVYAHDVSIEPDYAPNEPRTRSELVIPLMSVDSFIGVLDLQSTELDAFTQRDIDGLSAFAQYAASAIQNLRQMNLERDYAIRLEQDVTERTEQLERAKSRAEAVLNYTTDPILLLSPVQEIEQGNPAFHELYGAHSDEIFGQRLTELVMEDNREAVQTMLDNARDHRKPDKTEVTFVTAKLTAPYLLVELTASPFHKDRLYPNDSPSYVISIRDITSQRQMETALRQSLQVERELNETKSLFIRTVQHEFRTPMAVVLSSSEILRNYITQDPKIIERAEKHLKRIHDQVRHLESILDDVLFMSEVQSNTLEFVPQHVDLVELCQRLIDTLQAQFSSHRIYFSSTAARLECFIDVQMIEQVVRQLISNAVKYSPKQQRVDVLLTEHPDGAELLVRDYGVGIPPEDHVTVFEPFVRASNVGIVQGSGLGLSVVKQAVERHHGKVTLESVVGQGTTLRVWLPS